MSEEKKVIGFSDLYAINVNERTEKKNGMTYLSWAWAWAEFKKAYPDATYTVVKFNGLPYVYDPNTGYMVYTTVTAGGLTNEMWLPVMDGANNAMKATYYEYQVKNPKFRYAKKGEDGKYRDSYGNEQPEFFIKGVEPATMFDVNKTIMRCLTKNLAMFGLGLYIFAGEDLPEAEGDTEEAKPEPEVKKEPPKEAPKKEEPKKEEPKKAAKKDLKDSPEISKVMAAALMRKCEVESVDWRKVCEAMKAENIYKLTEAEYSYIIDKWDNVKSKCLKDA